MHRAGFVWDFNSHRSLFAIFSKYKSHKLTKAFQFFHSHQFFSLLCDKFSDFFFILFFAFLQFMSRCHSLCIDVWSMVVSVAPLWLTIKKNYNSKNKNINNNKRQQVCKRKKTTTLEMKQNDEVRIKTHHTYYILLPPPSSS